MKIDHPPIRIGDGIALLRGRAGPDCLDAALAVIEQAPPRHYLTPWGKAMSAAMTNCGLLGWYSDLAGYRYEPTDPQTGNSWPAIPEILVGLASTAAAEAGFPGFSPQACLVNLYGPEGRMGMHQDRDEHDFTQPVVSISFGRSARFRIGGKRRRDPSRTITLDHADILVFGGDARLIYHGLDRLDGPEHPRLGNQRINLTFRHVSQAH